MLEICVCGWYLEKFDDFYMNLYRVKDKHPVFVVSNRESEYLKTIDLPYDVRENTGLEWGAYNHYLMKWWNGAGVLFCHDDIEMMPAVKNGEILPPEYLFDRIANVGVDQAYIFGSRHEDVENYGQHGRMIYMGPRFLQKAKEMGGFWYDKENRGVTTGKESNYNAGIIAFHNQAQAIGGDVHRKIYIPSFALAKRGQRGGAMLEYGRWIDKVGALTDSCEKKLNLGCGDNYLEDYTNVDLHNEKADVKADARELPFDSEEYDLVECHHLLEHLTKDDAKKALAEWRRVLSPGGCLFMSCPDVIAFFDLLKEHGESEELWESFMEAVYGQNGNGMAHLYGYSRGSLKRTLEEIGFHDVEVKTAIGFRPTPSLLAIARK